MANVAKINGYDVKDAEARSDVSTLKESMTTAQGDIETLQNDLLDTKADLGDVTQLETTDKTDLVSAINEVKGEADDNADNIGTLSSLSTTDKTDLVSAINEVKGEADDNASSIAQNTANFAPTFSDVTSYAVGDYVTYNGVLYKCTTAHTAGVWVAGHFTQVTVGSELIPVAITTPTPVSGVTIDDNVFYGFKVGKLVTLVLNGIILSSDILENGMIASGLPSTVYARNIYFNVYEYNTNIIQPMSIINNSICGGAGGIVAGRYWGTVTYMTDY